MCGHLRFSKASGPKSLRSVHEQSLCRAEPTVNQFIPFGQAEIYKTCGSR